LQIKTVVVVVVVVDVRGVRAFFPECMGTQRTACTIPNVCCDTSLSFIVFSSYLFLLLLLFLTTQKKANTLAQSWRGVWPLMPKDR